MTAKLGIVGMLLAGAAPVALHAQESADRAAPDASARVQMPQSEAEQQAGTAPLSSGAAPNVEVSGPDGRLPTPPVQREPTEQLTKNSPGTVPPDESADKAENEIVVEARPRGAVVGDIPPQRTLSRLDLRAFGAENIGALLEVIGSQTASNGGRGSSAPVTLLNGRRVSDVSEILRIPTEAIERMEIFSEELALQYGYRADQKVVNIVTSPRFKSRVGQGLYLAPTEGGRDVSTLNFDYLALRNDTRLGLGAAYNHAGSLLESDRAVRQVGGSSDLGRSRTLLPETETFTLNALVSRPVSGNASATLNARFETSRSDNLVGLGDHGPLRRSSDHSVTHLGTTLSGQKKSWQWTLTANYDRTSVKILTDPLSEALTRDEARSTDTRANADLLLNGPIVQLPAGPLSLSLRTGVEIREFESRSSRVENGERVNLSRDQGAVQIDLDLPLLSRTATASALGTLSAHANLAIERLSDLGALRTFGYGLSWSPIEALSLIGSATIEEGAPTLEQLGAPLVITPNVRTNDFARGEIVDITWLSGGNAALRSDDRHVVRLGFNLRPLTRTDLTLSADYVATRVENPIGAFPIITPRVEAAFPDRIVRDSSGRLQSIDSRWINFNEARQRQLRWGFNVTRTLGRVPEVFQNARIRTYTSAEEARRTNPTTVFTRVEPGSAMAQGIGNLTSRFFVSVYHNWYLEDNVTLRDGRARSDLLKGEALEFLGGRRRHEVDFQAGVFKRGLGGRITGKWRSAAQIRGLTQTGNDLRFSSYATVNINLFANLAERFGGSRAPGWMKGSRASIAITNIFNVRPQVRDGAGMNPLSYQPAYLDPVGRTISFSLRKVF